MLPIRAAPEAPIARGVGGAAAAAVTVTACGAGVGTPAVMEVDAVEGAVAIDDPVTRILHSSYRLPCSRTRL